VWLHIQGPAMTAPPPLERTTTSMPSSPARPSTAAPGFWLRPSTSATEEYTPHRGAGQLHAGSSDRWIICCSAPAEPVAITRAYRSELARCESLCKRTEEEPGRVAVQGPMVEHEGQCHHRARHDLTCDHDRAFRHASDAENRDLRRIQDRSETSRCRSRRAC